MYPWDDDLFAQGKGKEEEGRGGEGNPFHQRNCLAK